MTITFEQVGFRYPGRDAWALDNVTWTVADGELALVTGPSGSGKSTMLRCFNGLVPHFSGGELRGRVVVDGLDTREHGPRALSRRVGFVFQDPDAQHVAPTVEDELAFGMEQHGVAPPEMRERVERMLHRLDLGHLRGRAITTLSGGERQRVAIGAAIAVEPRVLVLDEPLSQLDPASVDAVIAALRSLRHEGMTVVVAEHRVKRLMGIVDQVRVVVGEDGGGRREEGRDNAPMVWKGTLGRVCKPPAKGSEPLRPLDHGPGPGTVGGATRPFPGRIRPRCRHCKNTVEGLPYRDGRVSEAIVHVERADLGIGRRVILADVDLDIDAGEVVALVGANGSGKTTLLRSLLGALPPLRGRVFVDTGGGIAYLPQRPGAVLFNETVREELAFTLRVNPAAPDPTWLIDVLELGSLLDRDPRDLSAGERERAALGAVLAAGPELALLDEPTRGMDARRKATLADLLRGLGRAGTTVVVATHDAELVARAATRVVRLGDGRVVSETPRTSAEDTTEDAQNPVLDSRS